MSTNLHGSFRESIFCQMLTCGTKILTLLCICAYKLGIMFVIFLIFQSFSLWPLTMQQDIHKLFWIHIYSKFQWLLFPHQLNFLQFPAIFPCYSLSVSSLSRVVVQLPIWPAPIYKTGSSVNQTWAFPPSMSWKRFSAKLYV